MDPGLCSANVAGYLGVSPSRLPGETLEIPYGNWEVGLWRLGGVGIRGGAVVLEAVSSGRNPWHPLGRFYRALDTARSARPWSADVATSGPGRAVLAVIDGRVAVLADS